MKPEDLDMRIRAVYFDARTGFDAARLVKDFIELRIEFRELKETVDNMQREFNISVT